MNEMVTVTETTTVSFRLWDVDADAGVVDAGVVDAGVGDAGVGVKATV